MRNLKRSFLIILSALFSLCAFNAFSEVKEYSLSNGIPVYIDNIPENRICCVYFLVDGGVVYLSPEFSGLEDALFTMMTCGSENYSYEDNQSFAYENQTSFSSFSYYTGSGISMTCIDKYFDETFERFADGFLNPSYEEERYDDMMRMYRQNIQRTLNNPSSLVFYYAEKLTFSNHPYETSTNPTEDSLKNITIENLKKHHETLMDFRRIKVVACGDFDEEKLLSLLEQKLGSIGKQNYEILSKNVPEVQIEGENGIFVHDGAIGTGFILRSFKGPSYLSEEYPVSVMAANIYSDIMYNVVREKYGICYTPSSWISSNAAGLGYEYLYRTSDFENFKAALGEARKIVSEGKVISGKDANGEYIFAPLEEKLESYRNSYVTNRYQRQATTSGRAGRICSSLLAFGNATDIDKVTEKAISANVDEIVNVFKKYWCDSTERWFCVTGSENQMQVEKTLGE